MVYIGHAARRYDEVPPPVNVGGPGRGDGDAGWALKSPRRLPVPDRTENTNTPPIDLDDTSRCPLGVRCESCGAERDDLAICAVELGPLGMACLTMWPRCAGSDVTPPV